MLRGGEEGEDYLINRYIQVNKLTPCVMCPPHDAQQMRNQRRLDEVVGEGGRRLRVKNHLAI